MTKKAFITGVTGQDGSLLAKRLLMDGWKVYGGYRRGFGKLWRLDELGITQKIELIDYEIGNGQEIAYFLKKNYFDHIYHLAGLSRTFDSFNHPNSYLSTNLTGVLEILEACKLEKIKSRIFIAGSSEIFSGIEGKLIVDEDSEMKPSNPYGVSHVAIRHLARIYREVHGIPIYYGILFNHESYFRDSIFITKKIAEFFGKITEKQETVLQIGNIDSKRDWGLASEYVDAMYLLMSNGLPPEDYVFATGVVSSVRSLILEFAKFRNFEIEFDVRDGVEVGLDKKSGRIVVETAAKYLRLADSAVIAGNSTKLSNAIGKSFTKELMSIVKAISKN